MAQDWCYDAARDAICDKKKGYEYETLATLISIEDYLSKLCEHLGIKEE